MNCGKDRGWTGGHKCTIEPARRHALGYADVVRGQAISTLIAETKDHQFHSLDMLRGVAAIAVVGRHFDGPLSRLFPHSYLAVDLFFALSGFVIALRYETRLRSDLGWARFMRIRLIRMYPMYMIGTLLTALSIIALYHVQNRPIDSFRFIASLAAATLFLPTPRSLSFNEIQLFPFNFPAWSLCWELVVNGLYALVVRRLSDAVLMAIAATGALLLLGAAAMYGSLDAGYDFVTFWGAPLRVIYSFFIGIALFRLWSSGRMRWLRMPPLVVAALLLASFAVRPANQAIYDLMVVLVGFPMLILAATKEPSARLLPLFAVLGTVSFPIYALQAAFQRPEMFVSPLVQSRLPGGALLVELLFIAGMIVVALLTERYVDQPVRKWLRARARRYDARNSSAR